MREESAITQEMRDAIGTESEPQTYHVYKENIIKFAESIGDLNPMFHDEEAARNMRYGGLIAPPTFLRSTAPRYLEVKSPATYATGVDGGSDFHYFEPVRPGDEISASSRLVDLFERTGRLGDMLFVVRDLKYVNQFGTVVVLERSTGISLRPPDGRPAAQPPENQPYEPPAQSQQKEVPGEMTREQVYFEDVDEGTELPTLKKTPSTRQLVEYAAASVEFPEIHYDQQYAQSVGLPDVIVQGSLKHAFLGHLVTGWIGEQGTLKQLSVQYRRMDVPGTSLYCKAVVTRKYVENCKHTVDCDIWLENSEHEVTTPGKATVLLPSRTQ